MIYGFSELIKYLSLGPGPFEQPGTDSPESDVGAVNDQKEPTFHDSHMRPLQPSTDAATNDGEQEGEGGEASAPDTNVSNEGDFYPFDESNSDDEGTNTNEGDAQRLQCANPDRDIVWAEDITGLTRPPDSDSESNRTHSTS